MKQMLGVRGQLLPRIDSNFGENSNSNVLKWSKLLKNGLVVCHAGMASNVGPILEQVTEKYLLRLEKKERSEAKSIFEEILNLLCTEIPEVPESESEAIRQLGALMSRNFHGPIRAIIPEADNAYTQLLISGASGIPGFCGFGMHGGISGGGCSFFFDPNILPIDEAKKSVLELMKKCKKMMENCIPFAIEPVVYDWELNLRGTVAEIVSEDWNGSFLTNVSQKESENLPICDLKIEVDSEQHEQIRSDLLSGKIGLEQNLLKNCTIENVSFVEYCAEKDLEMDSDAVFDSVATVVLAGGLGSRWTAGSGTVKALSPFIRFGEKYFSFLDIHLAKHRRQFGAGKNNFSPPFFICTSFLTHAAIENWNSANSNPAILVRGNFAGQRLVPTVNDLRYYFAQNPICEVDEKKKNAKLQQREALVEWALREGEGSDYKSAQNDYAKLCHNPPGHLFELVNVLRLVKSKFPEISTLLVHNCDTTGAGIAPELLRKHRSSGAAVTIEVIPAKFGSGGGGLALVNGQRRIVEGIALDDMTGQNLSFMSTNTMWIEVAQMTDDLISRFLRNTATYCVLKMVKKSSSDGLGHWELLPVLQAEKLMGEISSVLNCEFICVPQWRGMQLKDVGEIEPWRASGAAEKIARLCGLE